MARHHMTPNGPVPFTPDEEAAWDAQEKQAAQEHQDALKVEYKIKRAAEYPSIGDQLDALFKAGVFPADMTATIQAVKNKYPKG